MRTRPSTGSVIELLDEAEAEMIAAAREFEERVEGLGRRFLAEVQRAFDRTEKKPGACPPWTFQGVPAGVRHMVLRPFKFTVVFVEEPRLVVVSVRNARKHPLYWVERLQHL